MNLRYALADLDEILTHIATHSPRGAMHVQARIKAITDLLLRHPRIGALTNDPTIPYLVFYEVADAK